VSVLRDGLRDDLSYSLMQQNFVFKMIMSFYDSSLGPLVGLLAFIIFNQFYRISFVLW
jgi:hypothetical protein